jgi:hypothetical protein
MQRSGQLRVINATGVIVHTNLGRAPLSEAAKRALLDAAGYCTLEYDLETGMKITAHINLESREYQSRWYTEVRCWKIESDGQRRQAPSTAQEAQPSSGPGIDDLPF